DDAVERLFGFVDRLSSPGSRFAIEHIDADIRQLATEPPMAGMAKDFGINVTDMWPKDKVFPPVRWLADHGWRVTSSPIGPLAEGYGRPFGPPAVGLRHTVLITAVKS